MTVPLDDVNDIRAMDAAGVPRAEITRRLRPSSNTVARYADMAGMSPAAPEAARATSSSSGPRVTAQVDFGDFEADVAGERLALKLLEGGGHAAEGLGA